MEAMTDKEIKEKIDELEVLGRKSADSLIQSLTITKSLTRNKDADSVYKVIMGLEERLSTDPEHVERKKKIDKLKKELQIFMIQFL